jgi:plasmid stabilization system protein ParE
VGPGEEGDPGRGEVTIVILRSAVDDLIRGRMFYEQQAEGVGAYFDESLSADIESLRLYAGIHPVVHGYHRKLSKRFPYAVYYELTGNEIRVRAILGCRRDPTWIQSQLRD